MTTITEDFMSATGSTYASESPLLNRPASESADPSLTDKQKLQRTAMIVTTVVLGSAVVAGAAVGLFYLWPALLGASFAAGPAVFPFSAVVASFASASVASTVSAVAITRIPSAVYEKAIQAEKEEKRSDTASEASNYHTAPAPSDVGHLGDLEGAELASAAALPPHEEIPPPAAAGDEVTLVDIEQRLHREVDSALSSASGSTTISFKSATGYTKAETAKMKTQVSSLVTKLNTLIPGVETRTKNIKIKAGLATRVLLSVAMTAFSLDSVNKLLATLENTVKSRNSSLEDLKIPIQDLITEANNWINWIKFDEENNKITLQSTTVTQKITVTLQEASFNTLKEDFASIRNKTAAMQKISDELNEQQ